MKHFKKIIALLLIAASCVCIVPVRAKADIRDAAQGAVEAAVVGAAIDSVKENPVEAGIGAAIGAAIGFFIPVPGATLWGAGIGASIAGAVTNSNK